MEVFLSSYSSFTPFDQPGGGCLSVGLGPEVTMFNMSLLLPLTLLLRFPASVSPSSSHWIHHLIRMEAVCKLLHCLTVCYRHLVDNSAHNSLVCCFFKLFDFFSVWQALVHNNNTQKSISLFIFFHLPFPCSIKVNLKEHYWLRTAGAKASVKYKQLKRELKNINRRIVILLFVKKKITKHKKSWELYKHCNIFI